MGHSVRRKEDPRFLRGKGNYVDDLKLPGMLHLDIVRSPMAHARIKSIDTEKAMAIPGVLAVITGKDLEQYNLAWMPTLMGDTQMVLPVDTVKFDGQEVAAVLATDRYTAADGVNAVEVEYEPLDVVVDPFKALEPDSTIVREDQRGSEQPHLALGSRRQGQHRARFPPERCHGQRGHLHTAYSRLFNRDLRLRRPVGPGKREADRVHDHTGSSPPSGLFSRWWPDILDWQSTRSGSFPQTLGAGSAAKCRSTPGTCWPSRPRSSLALR